MQSPEVRLLHVTEASQRLDKYLAGECPDWSRSRLQRLIEEGCVLVSGRAAKASQRLNAGDVIQLLLPPPQPSELAAEAVPLSIVYEDDEVIVVDKPAGMTTHPAPGMTSHTLVNALLAYCPDLRYFGDAMRPGIVHRLDKDTSGLTIVAKNHAAQQNLINQFRTRLVSKGYLVLVKGKLTPLRGSIEASLGRDPANRKRMAVVGGAREARTDYRVKEHIGNYSLLDVATRTGRTHQIRVHFSAIGYPVAGDHVYGVRVSFLDRQFLHAYRLGFRLPSTGEYREFQCELPADLKAAIEFIRLG
ncbi:MAG: RluA family pseudouridine synthase [Chloroflexi bacterium]|nr:RluA family pseudouridine synthase [Chloroflexota bacterium]